MTKDQLTKRVAELEREIEARLQLISDKETVIAKQSQQIIANQEELEVCRVQSTRKDEELKICLSQNADHTTARTDLEGMLDQYKKQYEQLRKDCEALKLDKHLPRQPLLKKVSEFLLALDSIMGGKIV